MEKEVNNEILQTIEEAMTEITTRKECICKTLESLKAIKAVAETLYPVPGDIISARYHYGIYIGHGEVIHLPVPTPEEPEPVFTLDFMPYFMGDKPIVVKRETKESINKPLLTEVIIKRAKSLLGKHLGDEINSRKAFANWCRYGATIPDVQNVSFETPEYLGKLFYLLGRCWSAANDRYVSSLGLSDIDTKCILSEAQTRHNQEVKATPKKGGTPELILLRTLFGSCEDHENIDEVIGKTFLICLRESNEDGSYTVSCFLMRKEDCSFNRVLMVWQTPIIREDLQKAFGSRNMCIIS